MSIHKFFILLVVAILMSGVATAQGTPTLGEKEMMRATNTKEREMMREEAKEKREALREETRERREDIREEAKEKREIFKQEKKELRATSSEKRKQEQLEKRKKNIEAYFERVARRLEAALNRMNAVADKLAARIMKLEEKHNVNLAEARAKLTTARNEILEGKAALGAARESMKTLLASETPKDLFPAVKDLVHKVTEAVRDAHKALVEAIKAIKADKKLQVEETGTSTENQIDDN